MTSWRTTDGTRSDQSTHTRTLYVSAVCHFSLRFCAIRSSTLAASFWVDCCCADAFAFSFASVWSASITSYEKSIYCVTIGDVLVHVMHFCSAENTAAYERLKVIKLAISIFHCCFMKKFRDDWKQWLTWTHFSSLLHFPIDCRERFIEAGELIDQCSSSCLKKIALCIRLPCVFHKCIWFPHRKRLNIGHFIFTTFSCHTLTCCFIVTFIQITACDK